MSSKIDMIIKELNTLDKSRKEKKRRQNISKATKGKKKPRKTKGRRKGKKQKRVGKGLKVISTDLSPKVVRDKKSRGDDITINIIGKSIPRINN